MKPDIHSYIRPGAHAHLVGIGGVSMSPLAEVLHNAGVVISGSDLHESAAVAYLRALGIPVVVMEPDTGRILAMVSKPAYDPNQVQNQWDSLRTDPESRLLNRVTQGVYPPGSTFKIITLL